MSAAVKPEWNGMVSFNPSGFVECKATPYDQRMPAELRFRDLDVSFTYLSASGKSLDDNYQYSPDVRTSSTVSQGRAQRDRLTLHNQTVSPDDNTVYIHNNHPAILQFNRDVQQSLQISEANGDVPMSLFASGASTVEAFHIFPLLQIQSIQRPTPRVWVVEVWNLVCDLFQRAANASTASRPTLPPRVVFVFGSQDKRNIQEVLLLRTVFILLHIFTRVKKHSEDNVVENVVIENYMARFSVLWYALQDQARFSSTISASSLPTIAHHLDDSDKDSMPLCTPLPTNRGRKPTKPKKFEKYQIGNLNRLEDRELSNEVWNVWFADVRVSCASLQCYLWGAIATLVNEHAEPEFLNEKESPCPKASLQWLHDTLTAELKVEKSAPKESECGYSHCACHQAENAPDKLMPNWHSDFIEWYQGWKAKNIEPVIHGMYLCGLDQEYLFVKRDLPVIANSNSTTTSVDSSGHKLITRNKGVASPRPVVKARNRRSDAADVVMAVKASAVGVESEVKHNALSAVNNARANAARFPSPARPVNSQVYQPNNHFVAALSHNKNGGATADQSSTMMLPGNSLTTPYVAILGPIVDVKGASPAIPVNRPVYSANTTPNSGGTNSNGPLFETDSPAANRRITYNNNRFQHGVQLGSGAISATPGIYQPQSRSQTAAATTMYSSSSQPQYMQQSHAVSAPASYPASLDWIVMQAANNANSAGNIEAPPPLLLHNSAFLSNNNNDNNNSNMMIQHNVHSTTTTFNHNNLFTHSNLLPILQETSNAVLAQQTNDEQLMNTLKAENIQLKEQNRKLQQGKDKYKKYKSEYRQLVLQAHQFIVSEEKQSNDTFVQRVGELANQENARQVKKSLKRTRQQQTESDTDEQEDVDDDDNDTQDGQDSAVSEASNESDKE